MKQSNIKHTLLAVACTLTASQGFADVGPLEEIVITAQKRKQSLQDVPISLNAVSGEFLEKNGLGDFDQLSAFVPNLHISESPAGPKIVVRGMGSGSGNRAFEQSVGLFVDGIYASRAVQFQNPFLDVERVEVLRGPQGVLFGKNTIAGAVTVHSVRPTDEFEAEITAKYEGRFGSTDVTGIISGAITGNLYGRLVLNDENREGYLDNTTLNDNDWGRQEINIYRATLVWDATENTQVIFKAEKSDFDRQGDTFQTFEPSLDLNAEINEPTFLEQESENYTLMIEYSLGDYELTYTGGYSEFSRDEVSDVDFTAAPMFSLTYSEDFELHTHEIRLASPVGRVIDWMVGAYYLDRTIEQPNDTVDYNLGPVLGIGPAFSLPNSYHEDTETYSVFAHITWNIRDNLRISAGLRYSDEEKSARASAVIAPLGSRQPIPDPVLQAGLEGFAGFFGLTGYDLPTTTRDETRADPSLNIQWDVNSNHMLYFAWTKASKSGGFSSTLTRAPQPDLPFQYKAERAENFEIGLKSEFMGGRGRLNLAVFDTDYDNLQVSSVDPTLNAFVTENAGTASSRGVEAELNFAATEALVLGANVSYLDGVYDEFTTRRNRGETIRDKQLISAPDWNGAFFADYNTSVFNNMNLGIRLDAVYTDDFPGDLSYSDDTWIDDYWKLNARISLQPDNGQWLAALAAYNLTDEITSGWAGLNTFNQGYHNTNPPRLVELSFTYRFNH